MRHFIFTVLLLFLAVRSWAAIAPATIWEINSAGSMSSSAGFNPANAAMPTDLTTDTGTGNTASPVVSSASYNFVAGDVNHYVYIQAGTNWIPGWYKIASVGSNKATLTAGIGAAQLTDYTDNTADGVATVATPTGGTWAIDYSRSSTARFTGTDLACPDGDAVSPTVTSASTPFGASHVGNIIKITSGANYTFANYEIVSVNTGTFTATLDRAVGTDGAKSSGTFFVGGAASMLTDQTGQYPSLNGITGGNTVWVTGTITTSATTQSFSGTATVAAPSRLEGYKTKRGDGYLGRSGSGTLVTTNFATFSLTGVQRFSASTTNAIIKNIRITGAVDNSVFSIASATNTMAVNISAENTSTGTSAVAIASNNTNNSILNCDATLAGASGGSSAIKADTSIRIVGCRVRGGPAAGITVGGASQLLNNVIFGCAGNGVTVLTTTSTLTVFGNTIVNCGGNGVDVLANSTGMLSFVNNMITDCTGFGIDLNTTTVPASIIANRLRDNVAGNIGLQSPFGNLVTYDNITTDGAAFSDYTNAGAFDFVPVAASPAVNAGLMDITIGALQRDQTGVGGSVEKSHTFVQ